MTAGFHTAPIVGLFHNSTSKHSNIRVNYNYYNYNYNYNYYLSLIHI